MIQSGIAPLDQHAGGMHPGRVHLMTGGPGTGKSTACLQFLQSGMANGECVVLLTLSPLSELQAHARHLGVELEARLRSGDLVLLRYRQDFTEQLAHAGISTPVIQELAIQLGNRQPARVAIDPLTPFLASGTSGATVSALVQWLTDLNATTLVTYPADVSNGYDARIDPLVQRAGSIIHLQRDRRGRRHIHIVQDRLTGTPPASVPFAWQRDSTAPRPMVQGNAPVLVATANGNGPAPLERDALVRVVAAHSAGEVRGRYALVMLQCEPAAETELHELARLAGNTIRSANGDLVTILDDRVAVYLQGARLRDAGPFIERVRTQWARRHRRSLRVESLAYPADEARLQALLALAQPA